MQNSAFNSTSYQGKNIYGHSLHQNPQAGLQAGGLSLYFLRPVGHTPLQPVLEPVQCQRSFQAGVPFPNRFILPLPELFLFQASGLHPGEISLIVFLINVQRVLSAVVLQLIQIRLLCRKLLAGAVLPLRDAVTIYPVIVPLDDKVPAAAFAFLKLHPGLQNLCEFQKQHILQSLAGIAGGDEAMKRVAQL